MFGNIIPDFNAFEEEQKKRFKSLYCGLCFTLQKRHGRISTLTLSNDLTFLAILLSALYESDEAQCEKRCTMHPIKRHLSVEGDSFAYVADINLALAYHKCLDDWQDEKKALSRLEAAMLERAYASVKREYPQKCRAIETWLDEIHALERENCMEVDLPMALTGRLLGELFAWKDDYWADALRRIGDGLGRFIYLMDAFEDLEKDKKKRCYNPLLNNADKADFHEFCQSGLMMAVADATAEFENLPIERDVDILRNILYSGIWAKYLRVCKNREKKNKECKNAGSL